MEPRPPAPAVHRGDRAPEGAGRRGRLEHARPRARRAAYTEDSDWRNRDEFFQGREAILDFLRRKWARELDYRLRKELWCFHGNRISVRFEYESHDADGQWWRSHGNEHWEFDELGYMRRRDASINDYKIDESERRIYVNRD